MTPMLATFGEVPVTLLDLSQSGMQATHVAPLALSEGRLNVDVPGRSVKLSLRCEVVWTRRDGARRISGLRVIDERSDLAADFLEYLLHLRKVRYNKATEHDRNKVVEAAPDAQHTTLSALQQIDETKPVLQAKEYLEKFPTVAAQWRAIAKRSTTESERSSYSLDILAVWELLNRSVRIEVVEFVFQLV